MNFNASTWIGFALFIACGLLFYGFYHTLNVLNRIENLLKEIRDELRQRVVRSSIQP
jgi:hypothetical protein